MAHQRNNKQKFVFEKMLFCQTLFAYTYSALRHTKIFIITHTGSYLSKISHLYKDMTSNTKCSNGSVVHGNIRSNLATL